MKKSKIIENQKELIEKQTLQIIELEEQLLELEEKKAEEILNKYRYAILVDDNYNSILWNDGRYERQVRELHFDHYLDELPKIEITK